MEKLRTSSTSTMPDGITIYERGGFVSASRGHSADKLRNRTMDGNWGVLTRLGPRGMGPAVPLMTGIDDSSTRKTRCLCRVCPHCRHEFSLICVESQNAKR